MSNAAPPFLPSVPLSLAWFSSPSPPFRPSPPSLPSASSLPRADPATTFPVVYAFSRAKPRMKPCPDDRFRPSPASSPPQPAAAGFQRRPEPPDPILAARSKTNGPDQSNPSQKNLLPVNPAAFADRSLCFSQINSPSKLVQK